MIVDPECVLVVEDEGLILMSLVEELEDAGLKVFEARSADLALKVLNDNPEIKALFTDVDMPGSMNGLDLAKLVRETRPDMSILITSGFLRMPKNDLPRDVSYIAKPYGIIDVLKQIRRPALP